MSLAPASWPRSQAGIDSWLARFQKQFLWLLVATYALAAFWPDWGRYAKQLRIAPVGDTGVDITFAALLLSWLLFSAGLGLSTFDIRSVASRPSLVISGLLANLFVPLAYLVAVGWLLFPFISAADRQNLFLGLVIVAAVPIASSSTAWCQNANGNLALSIGLVLLSTILSPFTTPFVIHLSNELAPGNYSTVLHHLSPTCTITFLVSFVLIPILAGILLRWCLGGSRLSVMRAPLKFFNLACLLVLNYSNASLSLPEVVSGPDEGFLLLATATTGLMCVAAFAAAWIVGQVMKADLGQQSALLFGLGMNNNGVGLVLASLAVLADTRILLPIILYNLWQHLIAGAVDHYWCQRGSMKDEPLPEPQ